MGQGLFTKVAQVVADAFQVDLGRIRITGTTTAKVPNTSATAASSGSDLNGMAAENAAEQIKARLIEFAAEKWKVAPDQVAFEPNTVRIGNDRLSFDAFIKEAYMARVHLSAAGFYKTPEIHWDRAAGEGQPLLLFRLWRRRLRGHDRHPYRRISGGPGGYPPRCRPLPQSRHRPGPGGGRLHPGHGGG